jgi:hypothetical protein
VWRCFFFPTHTKESCVRSSDFLSSPSPRWREGLGVWKRRREKMSVLKAMVIMEIAIEEIYPNDPLYGF